MIQAALGLNESESRAAGIIGVGEHHWKLVDECVMSDLVVLLATSLTIHIRNARDPGMANVTLIKELLAARERECGLRSSHINSDESLFVVACTGGHLRIKG